MKKILVTLIGFLLLQVLHSQPYYPFPSDTARWDCLYWHQWSEYDIIVTNTQYLLMGDTLIKGVSYKKIFYNLPDYESEYDTLYLGGIREDTQKNIYFYPVHTQLPTIEPITFPNDTSEHLLYMFHNLEPGMILPINSDVTQIKVDAIDSVLVGDSYRKRYFLQNQLLSPEIWIEGIGSTITLFSSYTYFFEWTFYTLCFTDTATYHINSPNGEDSCHYWFPNSVDDIALSKLFCYPNPASATLVVDTKNQNGFIRVYDALGQLVINNILVESKVSIDIEAIKPGLYFLEFTSLREKHYLKFIKRNT